MFKAAMLSQRTAIEDAINTDFRNRSRHETAMMKVLGVVQGIDYLHRDLRRFMRPVRRHIALLQAPFGKRADRLLNFFLR